MRGDEELEAKGAELLNAVRVMDALRAQDGDAWSAAQTHHSLARYLLEESHEVLEAIETGEQTAPGADEGPAALADELGDLLFQILFHARIAEREDPAWDIDDVARAFVAKMHRRNPHVFDTAEGAGLRDATDVEEIIAQWHAVKARERAAKNPQGTADGAPAAPGASWFSGIPHGLPALQRAAKVVHRARSDGDLDQVRTLAESAGEAEDVEEWGAGIARDLLEVVIRAERADVDPESALRTLVTRMGRDLSAGGTDPLA